jgi:hypothetical protein
VALTCPYRPEPALPDSNAIYLEGDRDFEEE